jgi:hypothetical protein
MGNEELQLIRKTATWNFPQATQARLDDLLNCKPDLSPGEIRELDALIALNDEMSAFKASALKLLHQRGEPVG